MKRDNDGRRFVAWYSAAPHAGRDFPSLDIFINGQSASSGDMDLQTSLDLWVLATNAVAAQGG